VTFCVPRSKSAAGPPPTREFPLADPDGEPDGEPGRPERVLQGLTIGRAPPAGEHLGDDAERLWGAPTLLFRIVQCIVRDMQKSAPPPLLPLLRSRLQAEVLTLVLLHPDREWTMTELASRVGSAVSSVQREIVRAEQAGVMTSRRVGKTRLVKAARSPITER
jgi:hypothetical protein